MNSKDIENSVLQIFDNFSKEEFIYDLLMAYGISKTSVTRLKKGDFNLSKEPGVVLYKKKMLFKKEATDRLFSSIDSLSRDERVLKHSPRFIIVTDYETLTAKDLKTKRALDIPIAELPKHFDFFLPLAGSEVYITKNDNKADRDAAYKMAELYDNLLSINLNIKDSKESVHGLNLFLSRLLFCFFAEDTGIFDGDSIFTNTLVQHTADDGGDTHTFLNRLFERLNSKDGEGFPAYLAQQFPYVNGGLFRDNIDSPRFNRKARATLIDLGELQWQDINPDIFGSMIQAVVLPGDRGDQGMHYTSVENILKLIRPLFLDELYEEFEKRNDNISQLRRLILRMSKIKFFDPACGSGNFLIITYKEIRVLEIKILQRIIELTPNPAMEFTQMHLSQFYGIELDDFAHEIAILSLWLAEHQMNKIFEEQLHGYGQSRPILPLKEAGKIIKGNATRLKWEDVCPIERDDEAYIIGNPPYLGYSRQDAEQKKDMKITFVGIKNFKKLDYISCWFYLASKYIEGKTARYAFVSTNSITQGEQVALLWPLIFRAKQEIFFAHKSFKWTNNAKGQAGVAVVIIGIRNENNGEKYIYDKNVKQNVRNISPYLANTANIIVLSRTKPVSNLPHMIKGSSPGDDGNLLLDSNEMEELLRCPQAIPFIKKYMGAQEFIKGIRRYCIYVTKDSINDAYKIKELALRFEAVKQFRQASKKSATKLKAAIPHCFDEDKYQTGDFILIPQTGSERREYIPIGYYDDSYLPSNATRVIYGAEPWIFGMIISRMHIIWVKAVAGRLKTDMQYSNTLCYNTFPFPNISNKQKETLSLYVCAVLDERAKHPEKTMAQLYDPKTMPAGLRKAHQELDKAIEQCYRLQPFTNDTERLEYLFRLYEEMIQRDTLFAKQKKIRTKK